MKTRRFFLFAAPAFVFASLCASAHAAAPPPLVRKQWVVDGVAREALVYLPPNVAQGKAPVVFVFHGHGGSMAQAARSFPIPDYWPEAIVVYPQGLKTPGQLTDPNGLRAGWQKGSGDQNDRDLKFFDAVFASLKADYRIDDSRVFSTGHSNGGGFTYLLWATRGKLFRAVAPSSAVLNPKFGTLTPKPALHLAGVNDPLVRYNWQALMMDEVKKINGCDASGKPWAKDGSLTGTLYASKTGTPFVTLIHPGGHVIPREAPALIVRFFKEVSSR